MYDYQLDLSVKLLTQDYEKALASGKKTFTIHRSFFDGLDKNAHLNVFLSKVPVRIISDGPFEITFEVIQNRQKGTNSP
ncbi:hypothetical protein [Streptococcus equi]|uniref:hypothetical protein n=1 Tax=Streptococcus equi TaxID=1336 RepID=UPI000657D7CF|nr:hypothetical protein SE071780_00171 [Streptococcus equi subsp. equi]MCD3371652.1 hypothetical protein [Streptococcus equi subsp. zooepidemicus]NBK44016.1 hypothetical protein [Streptococcus equi]ASB96418.1 hypothetical protein SE071780_00811 [Streptococcus equi subsp. equi]MBT1222908.1 hypothetical protein [Streptococcus equi subsp. equi]